MAAEADLRIGVVGLGMRSTLASYAHRPGSGARIVACCDTHPRRRDSGKERFGSDIVTVADHRDLLACNLDAAMVLTPDHTHEQISIELLEGGVGVFVEKPLAISTEACDRILETARRTGTPLYVGHNMRHLPVVRTMRDLIRQGAVGEVKTIWCRHFVGHGGDYYFRDWHADRRNTGSLLLQKGAHDLDVIHWLAGGSTRRVQAFGALAVYGPLHDRRDPGDQLMADWYHEERNWPPAALRGLNPVIDVEDVSLVNLMLASGVLASYQQCHFSPDYWRNYTVIGTAGRLENFGDTHDAVVKVWNRRSGYRQDADVVVQIPNGEGSHGGADSALMAEFLSFARHGGATVTSPVAARDAVAAGLAATASLRSAGQPIDVPQVPPHIDAYFGAGQRAARDPQSRRTPGQGLTQWRIENE